MLTFAVALNDKGVPVPEIAKKLVIKTGKSIGKNPSAASLYRALAEAEDWSRHVPGDRSSRPEDPH
ncbi:hypothetical protein [Streptomyces alboniger]|uniref:hypothetical protein n=1 Tax=Streptomyces alboniger TaxID=132473 RepID=UPI000AC4E85F|nr:hypothetical protein [Streptomyces alboniger]